jgi:Fimbrial assembly protein (PilN)
MTMRRLELDFLRSGRQPGWAAWTLLALALAFALDLGRSWYVLDREIARNEARLVAHAGPARQSDLLKVSSRNTAPSPIREGELAAARDTLQRLSVPWDALFGALEAAQTERASLISIEPDAGGGTVTLTGEAKDYLAALSYVANLEQQKFLSRVHLARHETRLNDPQRPVAFTISASWKERR